MAKGSDRVAFLGPEGTFTEEALLANMPEGGLHPFPYPSIRDVLARRAERRGRRSGIVAIENALEGSVPVTLDSLAWGFEDLQIVREVTHPVHQMLITRSAIAARPDHQGHQHPARLRTVPRLHPRAPRQRRARGDRLHRRGGSPREPRGPAVGGRRHAARRGDVRVPHRRRGHRGLPKTTARASCSSPASARRRTSTGRYKTSIVCGIDQDEPGSLLLILSEFAYRHVNLSKVESRPSKQALGHYVFFIDVDGSIEDTPVAQAIKCLACKLPWLKVLGSYPA